MKVEKLTPLNGFDTSNLDNAKQNNYAWSMSELEDYIYVGTGKNILLWPIRSIGSQIPGFKIPVSVSVNQYDETAEVWRYKKDGSREWERVFKAPEGIEGFRFMITHKPYNARTALYVAGSSNSQKSSMKIFKTYNGVIWKEVSSANVKGNTSRSMVIHNGKIYIATAIEQTMIPYLYSSSDPEIYPWKTELDPAMEGYDETKNPKGSIYNISSFNNHLYVSTSGENGVQVWRTNGLEPQLNEWTLIADNGFGDKANTWSLSIGQFKDHLYVSATTALPKGYLLPKGADIVRIDKNDNWELIVGGEPVEPIAPTKGVRGKSRSGYDSGFSNPLNIYFWQIREYKNVLYVTTLDHGLNLQVLLETLLLNEEIIKKIAPALGYSVEDVDNIINIYRELLKLLDIIGYPFGFDIFESYDGVHFIPLILNGLGNPENYGGRILYEDSKNDLYIGTANPYEGCEVWRTDNPLALRRLSNIRGINLTDILRKIQELKNAQGLIAKLFDFES